MVDACHALARAFDAAAVYIAAQKAEAVTVLIGMAAAVATFGVAEAAVPLIIEGAERLVKSLVMDLEQHLKAATEPLFAKVDSAMAGLDWSGSGGAPGSAGRPVSVDSAAVHAQPAVLRTHATTMRNHGTEFAAAAAGLGF